MDNSSNTDENESRGTINIKKRMAHTVAIFLPSTPIRRNRRVLVAGWFRTSKCLRRLKYGGTHRRAG